jgi:hypothetical protein
LYRYTGALDDVIMLDSESPMFPSCTWSNMVGLTVCPQCTQYES